MGSFVGGDGEAVTLLNPFVEGFEVCRRIPLRTEMVIVFAEGFLAHGSIVIGEVSQDVDESAGGVSAVVVVEGAGLFICDDLDELCADGPC